MVCSSRSEIGIGVKLFENYQAWLWILLHGRVHYNTYKIEHYISPVTTLYEYNTHSPFPTLYSILYARTTWPQTHPWLCIWLMVNLNHIVFCILLFFYTCKDLRKVNVFVTRRKNSNVQRTYYTYIYRVAIEQLVIRVLFVCRNVKQRLRYQDLALGLHNSNCLPEWKCWITLLWIVACNVWQPHIKFNLCEDL